ncbi:MAG: hypothetical protein KDD67_14950 [Ignavibacteriae bacterium]|nr:hypothetical protein [Ignavibacteriota bacterium]MCB9217605.1 hypothetical protein [Ignavibacteria bacterium]
MPVHRHIITLFLLFGVGLLIQSGCKSSEATVDGEAVGALKGVGSDTSQKESASAMAAMITREGEIIQDYWSESRTSQRVTQISPRTLYSGPNALTIKNVNGISSISVRSGAEDVSWSVEGAGFFPDCPEEQEILISIETVSKSAQILVEVVDCNQNESAEWVQVQNKIWTLDEVIFPDVRVGQTVCRPFRVSTAQREILDSVTFPSNFPLTFESEPEFPVEVFGTIFWYNVCFTGKKPGVYVFPVITWMRREEPAGGYKTYAVADTGRIRVIR